MGRDPPSGRRDSNPRPSPWQGDALPLSHVRMPQTEATRNLSRSARANPNRSARIAGYRDGMKAWLDGQVLQSPEQPAIGVLDHGIIVGDGVFETIKIEDGSPFALTRHLDRLVRSAEGLGIGKPDVSAIREGIAATMEGQDISF